ncbi:YihY/virulence factor BrkB family protein [Motilibacter peucedani]|uniref:YihY/virulence factor BrkB family protein n=1 Tax=Motilibacter peucedani TaxID=598650 RepID=UPI000EB0F2FC|nr:YhjD/YihY/BrkB family envelope integrity protein [Motilibacter peucedani]
MPLSARLDRLQQRRPALGLPIAVVYKYADDQGPYLAALITYYGFISLFPLLLLLSTVTGFVLAGDASARDAVVGSALHQFPIARQQLDENPAGIGGGPTGLVIGLLGALYGGLGIGQAVQNAMNTVWQVPRNNRPNPLLARLRGLALLATAGVAVALTAVLSSLAAGAGALTEGHGTWWQLVVRAGFVAGSVVVNTGVFVLAFRHATTRSLTIRQVIPGAVCAAVVYQLLQSFGATYVSHVVRSASAVNSLFAVVLGLLAFLYLASAATVLCAEINVVRVDRLWPRALLTPFTDDVDLTPGDEKTYTGTAKAARSKGFEQVDVTFDKQD